MLAFDQGDLESAASLLEEGLSVARELDDSFILWPALYQRGDMLRRLGQHARARPMLEEALAVARTWGNAWNSAMSLTGLAQLALAEGNLDRATTLTEESLALWTRIGDARSYRTSIWQLGEIALANDDPRRAAGRFTESLNLSLQASSRGEIARCLDGIVAAGEMADHVEPSGQRSTQGAHLLGAAAALREADGTPVATIPKRVHIRAGDNDGPDEPGRRCVRGRIRRGTGHASGAGHRACTGAGSRDPGVIILTLSGSLPVVRARSVVEEPAQDLVEVVVLGYRSASTPHSADESCAPVWS